MKRSKEKGFSLLEVLVALAIFGILMEGLLLLLKQENLLTRAATEMFQARLLANATMETLQASPFDQLQSYAVKDAATLKDGQVNVSVSDLGATALKKIVVTVQWMDRSSRERKLTLATVRSQYPLTIAATKGGSGQ